MFDASSIRNYARSLDECAQQARVLAIRAEHSLAGMPEVAYSFRQIASELEACAWSAEGPIG